MQDNYIGDIGDYGKYGLLRQVCSESISLAVNWYRVRPKIIGKQNDGKYTNYLSSPLLYRGYDPALFDALHKIVLEENDRRLERIETAELFRAVYFSKEIGNDRLKWHQEALEKAKEAEVVFLDPDNGLETRNMNRKGTATEKHVKWSEIKDYYMRGQNIILYQHRPQRENKKRCIERVMGFQRDYLLADGVKLLEFPKYTNRFYFMFLHESYRDIFEKICLSMTEKWSKNDFCHEIILG